MKNLLIATFCLLILIIPWNIYNMYSEETINKCVLTLQNIVIPSLKSSDWEKANYGYDIVCSQWNKFENTSEFFIDAAAINETSKLIDKTDTYINMQDADNAAASSSELIPMLEYLYENETVSFANVF